MRNRKGSLNGLLGTAVLLAVLGIGILAQGARAQVNPFGKGGSLALTERDLTLLREAQRSLLDEHPVGSSLRWDNSDSENSGTITLLRTFQRDGRDCWRVRHDFDVDREARTYELNLCIADDGTRKLLF